jgi:hypothetical protein
MPTLSERRIDASTALAAEPAVRAARPTPLVKPRSPYTEESISLRRMRTAPPFPGQRKLRSLDRGTSSEPRDADRVVEIPPEREVTAPRPSFEDVDETTRTRWRTSWPLP